ncbi:MAG TPA: hypothetical protein P5556_04790 [Candidatus Gastranaerophilales bacterium]|nr:hypothetical protein [Candidatus Gastranaerophilales bacterium]
MNIYPKYWAETPDINIYAKKNPQAQNSPKLSSVKNSQNLLNSGNIYFYPLSFGQKTNFKASTFASNAIINKVSFGAGLKVTPKTVTDSINQQLDIIKPTEIQNLINSFPEEDRPLAAKLTQKMTQFGNMESLNEIATYARANSSNLFSTTYFYKNNLINMSSVMTYMEEKDLFNKIPYDNSKAKNPYQFYILDKVSLEELETNKEHLKEIKNNPSVQIIYPEGWINGMNPFTQNENLYLRIKKFIPEIKTVQQNENLDEDKAISKVLNREIIEKIDDLGLSDKFTIIQNQKTNNAPATAEQIAKQLEPPKMKEEKLQQVIDKLPEDQKQTALNFLMETTKVYSPRSLTQNLINMHDNFIKHGLIDKDGNDNTYYFIPKIDKSFGLIGMMYKLANNIPNNKFIYDPQKIPNNAEKVIIVDDLAASGNTYASEQEYNLKLLNEKKPLELIIAPILSTEYAAKRVPDSVGNSRRIKCAKCLYMPNKYIKSMQSNEFFNSFDETEYHKIIKLAGSLGIENMGLSVAMPYMSPDNNNQFFRKNFAAMFTLNGKGVKLPN